MTATKTQWKRGTVHSWHWRDHAEGTRVEQTGLISGNIGLWKDGLGWHAVHHPSGKGIDLLATRLKDAKEIIQAMREQFDFSLLDRMVSDSTTREDDETAKRFCRTMRELKYQCQA